VPGIVSTYGRREPHVEAIRIRQVDGRLESLTLKDYVSRVTRPDGTSDTDNVRQNSHILIKLSLVWVYIR
jgi:hypothetical protein